LKFSAFVRAYWPVVCSDPFISRRWHGELFDTLEGFKDGPAAAILMLPRMSGKSLIVGSLWPMWLAAQDRSPGTDMMLMSYKSELAYNNWKACRGLGHALFRRDLATMPERRMVTPYGGRISSKSIHGTTFGTPYDVIIIDEVEPEHSLSTPYQIQSIAGLFDRLLIGFRPTSSPRIILTCSDITSSIQKTFAETFDKVFPPRVLVKRLE
jgi:hypothetical protein